MVIEGDASSTELDALCGLRILSNSAIPPSPKEISVLWYSEEESYLQYSEKEQPRKNSSTSKVTDSAIQLLIGLFTGLALDNKEAYKFCAP